MAILREKRTINNFIVQHALQGNGTVMTDNFKSAILNNMFYKHYK